MRTRTAFAVMLYMAAACTIDARDVDESAASQPSTDGGSTTRPGDYTVTYTAPAGATATSFCSNFTSSWTCTPETDSTATWIGSLDERRLRLSACPANAVGRDCGYVYNVVLSTAPYWGVTQAGGTAIVTGSTSAQGPLPAVATPVDNGINGGNFHLHL